MGGGIAGFICFLAGGILTLLWWAIIISAILSWLFAFNVINHRNQFVNQLASFLDAVTGPLLAPLRSFIPPLGGMDITPIILLLLIRGVQLYLLPPSCAALYSLLGGV